MATLGESGIEHQSMTFGDLKQQFAEFKTIYPDATEAEFARRVGKMAERGALDIFAVLGPFRNSSCITIMPCATVR